MLFMKGITFEPLLTRWPVYQRLTQTSKHCMVYDILPSTTAVFSYGIGSIKLSANEQFFVGAQTVAGLLQTTQISDWAIHL